MKIRIVVIEDDEGVSYILSSLLKKRGYEVLSYAEPSLCPIYRKRRRPCPRERACGDIFIADMSLPIMTGLAFIENQLRNDCKAIVQNKAVMSGIMTDAELERAERLGCKVIKKPFDFNELHRWLNECEKRIDPDRRLIDLSELSADTRE